jgi:hypothetical protein
MLKLIMEAENFKQFSNEKGYLITVNTSDTERPFYMVLIKNKFNSKNFDETKADEYKYLPHIIVDNYSEDGIYKFELDEMFHVKAIDADETIIELEKCIIGCITAKESIDEFKKAIEDHVI